MVTIAASRHRHVESLGYSVLRGFRTRAEAGSEDNHDERKWEEITFVADDTYRGNRMAEDGGGTRPRPTTVTQTVTVTFLALAFPRSVSH